MKAAQLFTGDALKVLGELPPTCVDAVITDPPYSSGGQFRGDRAAPTGAKYGGERMTDFAGDNRDQRGYLLWSNLWMGDCLRLVKPGGSLLVFTDWRQLPITTDAVQVAGWLWRGLVPWVKPNVRPQPNGFAAQCEYVVWASRGAINRDYADAVYLPGFFHSQPPRDRDHQTQKPLDVMRQLVQVVPVGGTVLDPFMGSGTTGVAAVTEGRQFIGVELTEHYARVAEERIRDASGDRCRANPSQAALFTGDAL